MINEFVAAWNKNKSNLEEFFRTHKQSEYSEYKDLVKLVFDIVINPEMENDRKRYYTDDIHEIDDGDYQGTAIFILCRRVYQPEISDYVCTNTYYGSRSGCDTLMAINDEGYLEDLPSDDQVSDYMTLCMHLLQRCAYLLDGEQCTYVMGYQFNGEKKSL